MTTMLATDRAMGYLDFLEELMPGQGHLREDFLEALSGGDAVSLCAWFSIRGFQVTMEECAILIGNRNAAAGKAVTCAWY